jgi:sterol desaturase/sphingolipid hydroxylase (fatty acid hydroxylase superfamily)
MDKLVHIAIGLVILGAIFWLIESLFPARRGQRKLRATLGTDVIYFFFTPLVTKGVTRVAVIAVLVLPALLIGPAQLKSIAMNGYGPIATLPIGMQALAAFVLGDFIGYWTHRWFHGRRLWPYHAVHHSSVEVDWLSSVRLHPVNDALARIAQAIPLLLLGFPATVLAIYVPVISFYAIMLHANVSWTWGPLRYAIASPAFHRWHHTTEAEGRDKNFAGFFPLWDLLFGTFYMPRGRQPERFGIERNDVPPGFLGQMLYPFRRR